MTVGNVFRHISTYTVFNLGDYDIILGMPFWNFAQVRIDQGQVGPEVSVQYKRARIGLPLMTSQDRESPRCYKVSTRDLRKDIEGATEMYSLHYKGFRAEDNLKFNPGGCLEVPLSLKGEPSVTPSSRGQSSVEEESQKSSIFSLAQGPSASQDKQVVELLKEYSEIFPDDLPNHPPPERPIEFKVPLKPGFEPPCQAPYKANVEAQKVIEETLKYLYDHGLARDSNSEFGAPVTLAKKADGTWRFCVDYRKLNAVTKEAKYPLPRIDDCLDKLGKAKFFSKIDLRSGYWQMRVAAEDVEKTAFRTQNGHHEWLVMPFGLQGAPSCFQRLMNNYLRPFLGKFVLVYLDDILIYSNSEEEHLEHLKLIFQVLKDNKLYAKRSKCDFFKTRIQFLGFVIENHSIKTDPEKIEAIKLWPLPTTVRELRSFLGLANFYRKFVSHYAEKAKPLTDILKSTEFKDKFGHKFSKTAPISLGDKEKESFQSLKDALTEAPCLIIYDHEKPTEVWADASYEHATVGAVLMQDHGQGFQPVAFLSKVLNQAESHYPTFEQELLALKIAFDQWRPYLLPLRFTARTDHNGLKYLKTQKHLSERQWRWLAFFSEYQVEVKYRPGAKMQVPDALSRRVKDPTDLSPILRMREADDHKLEIKVGQERVVLHMEATRTPTLQDLKTPSSFNYEEDEALSKIFTALRDTPEAQETIPKLRSYNLRDGLLYWKDGIKDDRLVVPCGQRIPLIKEFHDSPLGGHFGHEKVYASMKRYFYWAGMKELIKRYIATCDLCQKNKSWNQKPLGLPQVCNVPQERWDFVSTDFCGPFPTTKSGNDYVMVVTDHLSKMAYAIPCRKTITAREAAKLYLKYVFRYHGMPKVFLSDRGPQFTSTYWRELWKRTGTSLAFTSPYYPKGNAQTERYNRTFEEGLRSFVNTLQDDWDDKLIIFEFAYNDTTHPSTGYTPMFMNYGRHPTKPTTLKFQSRLPAVQTFLEELNNVLTDARDHVLQAQVTHAEQHTPHFQQHNLKVNDWVLLKAENYDLNLPSRKLAPRWLGPFQIIEMKGPNTVKLELPKRLTNIEATQNVSWLKPYKRRTADLGPSLEHPTPEVVDDHEEDEVEAVLADRYSGKRKEYLIRFSTYGVEADEWLPLANLQNCQELIEEYWQRQSKKRA